MRTALLFLTVSLNVYALDCGGIPEGQVIRLDQGDGPLAKAAVQDQDGVGSCYANQSSLLLQSVIPDHPNLSYLNLGLYYTNDKTLEEQRNKGNYLYTLDKQTSDGKTLYESKSAINGGFACKTIQAALDRQRVSGFGSLCKAEDVALEHTFFNDKGNFEDSRHKQEIALTGASRYMNSYQKHFGFAFQEGLTSMQGKREEADRFSNALRNFVKNSSDSFFAEKCSKKDEDKFERLITNSITRALNAHPECISKNRINSSAGPACQGFDRLGYISVNTTNNSSKINFIFLNEHRQKMFKAMDGFFANKDGYEKFESNLTTFMKQLDKSKTAATQKDKFAKEILSSMSPEDKNAMQIEYNRIALGKFDDCKSQNVLAYFKDRKEFQDKAKADAVLCNYSELIERASDLAGVLPEKTFSDMSAFVDFITSKAGLKYDDALLSLIAKDCAPEKRVTIPENLKCESSRVLFDSDDFTPEGPKETFITTVTQNRQKMFASIKDKKAVGLDICTKFWNQPEYDFHKENSSTKFNTCSNTGIHGFHAITMIGYRCQNNKLQYLAQNSWGPTWNIPGDPYEIEDGKIWMDEEKLFMNLDNINYLSQ